MSTLTKGCTLISWLAGLLKIALLEEGCCNEHDLFYDQGGSLRTKIFADWLLAKCVVAFPHGMGGDDGYWDIEGYEEFGEEYIPLDNEYCKGHATVISFGIVYVDEKGVEFIVNLE